MNDKKPVPPALAEFAVEQMAQSGTASTPANHWSGDGEEDPHANRYDCERAALVMGDLTDDELANAVFLHGNETPDFQQVLAGKAKMPIAYLTAAKDRIRWLSRVATKALAAIASRDAVIEQRNGECVRLHARIEDLEAQLEDTEERRDNAARNSSAFEDRMGALQVENGKLQARIAELDDSLSCLAELLTAVQIENDALKAQQPSAGVVLPERDDSFGSAELDEYANGYRHGWNAYHDAAKDRLNPCRAQAVQVNHDSDCSTNNHGVPELLGPCDCSASKDK